MSRGEAFQRRTSGPVLRKRHCQHPFIVKHRQRIRTGAWFSCLAWETQTALSPASLCPSWVLTCETVAMLPFGKVLSAWNCCERTNYCYFLLLTVGIPELGNLRNKYMDAWTGRELERTPSGPPPMTGGSADTAKHTYPAAQSLCSNLPQP